MSLAGTGPCCYCYVGTAYIEVVEVLSQGLVSVSTGTRMCWY